MCNFVFFDMVGYIGDYDVVVKVIIVMDVVVKIVYDVCEEVGYVFCVIVDYGNVEQMLDFKIGNFYIVYIISEFILDSI